MPKGGGEGVWERPEELFSPGPPPAVSLLLVGTVHGDPQGYARAWELLECFRPQTVAVEISPFSVHYRERHGARWQMLLEMSLAALPQGAAGHLAIRRLLAQIAMPFEWRAACDYGQRYGVEVIAVDASAPARQHLPRYAREVLIPENLRALLLTPDGSLPDFVHREFRRARLTAFRPLTVPFGGILQAIVRRERLAARRLQKLAADGRRVLHLGGWEHLAARRLQKLAADGRRVLHLGGWEHLAPRESGDNLYDLLAPLRPRRILLDEADRLPAAAVWPNRQNSSRLQG